MADTNFATKICIKCKTERLLSEFHRHSGRKDGHTSKCKPCANSDAKNWYENNKERHYANFVAWRNAHPERFREIQRASDKKLYSKRSLWAKNNPEKRKQVVAKWMRLNMVYCRVNSSNYRARKRKSDGEHTPAQIQSMLSNQKHKCACCKHKLVKFQIDHVVPLARGGSNDISNIQLLCPRCNRSKGAKHPIDFMQERGFLL